MRIEAGSDDDDPHSDPHLLSENRSQQSSLSLDCNAAQR